MLGEFTKIVVVYNSNEISIQLDSFDDNMYSSLIKVLSETTNEKNIVKDFKLMALNTSVPYLLVDENNLWNIIREVKSDGYLKLFMDKNVTTEKDEDDDTMFSGVKIKEEKNFDDDFDDFDSNTETKNDKNENDVDKEKQINKVQMY